MRILNVVGARPNFMKMAPLIREMARFPDLEPVLVHTGQHYDAAMSEVFFGELGIPEPDVNLGVGSGTHAEQTAAIMTAFEPVLVERAPDLVVVVGDVNSTMACTLVAVKRLVPVAHVEAGLRSFDRTMPEEINRIVTDALATFCFTTSADANDNLRREGVSDDRIFFVGNVMIDTLLAHRERAMQTGVRAAMRLDARGYALVTLHRPSNVDDEATFDKIATAFADIAPALPIVFAVHPRTRPVLERNAVVAGLTAGGRLRLLDPLGYLDFVALMAEAAIVLTDSGGVQEETTILGVPCLTLRTTTERPVTVTHGTNRVVGVEPAAIVEGFRAAMRSDDREPRHPPLWDGRATERIVRIIRERGPSGATEEIRLAEAHHPPR